MKHQHLEKHGLRNVLIGLRSSTTKHGTMVGFFWGISMQYMGHISFFNHLWFQEGGCSPVKANMWSQKAPCMAMCLKGGNDGKRLFRTKPTHSRSNVGIHTQKHVCMYVYMYVCIYICTFMHAYISTYETLWTYKLHKYMIWLVVSTIFSISYMGCHPSHWLSYVSGWLLHHQAVIIWSYVAPLPVKKTISSHKANRPGIPEMYAGRCPKVMSCFIFYKLTI